MNTHNLITMVNRIAQFFASMPDHQEALVGVRNHVEKFWTSQMRSDLSTFINDGATKDQIHPLAIEALNQKSI